MDGTFHAVAITTPEDIVTARRCARRAAALLGFDLQDQTRIAAAVSELARGLTRCAPGQVELRLKSTGSSQVLAICIRGESAGCVFASSPDLFLHGVRRLMDQVEIHDGRDGAPEITIEKALPARAPFVTRTRLQEISRELGASVSAGMLEELQQQNRELLAALSELRERQEELLRLNRELEDANRGMLALYAELDERADHLRRADEMKSRFLSNVSHELRTPLNSIKALARLLLDRTDGELTSEQERQVGFIARSADELAALVDDLLDLAKIEAGRTAVNAAPFSVAELLGTLKGMLRPLLPDDGVVLVFEEPDPTLTLHTDEGKVSQILRNFIANAIKFTERGEVRVSATLSEDGRMVRLSVADTGIGIEPEYQAVIFEEFAQAPNPLQGRARGTGLGLPLCRRLARLLGGDVELHSVPGVGSCFTAVLPVRYEGHAEAAPPACTPKRLLADEDRERLTLRAHAVVRRCRSSAERIQRLLADGIVRTG